MKVELVKAKDLIKYKLNAKLHPQSQIEGIELSIRKFGFIQPIVISQTNEIIIGHARFEASKRLEMEKVPCVRVENLSADEIKALRLIDNRIAETGWDGEILGMDIGGFDFDFSDFSLDFNHLIKLPATPDFKPVDADSQGKLDQLKTLKCPNCNFEWKK